MASKMKQTTPRLLSQTNVPMNTGLFQKLLLVVRQICTLLVVCFSQRHVKEREKTSDETITNIKVRGTGVYCKVPSHLYALVFALSLLTTTRRWFFSSKVFSGRA